MSSVMQQWPQRHRITVDQYYRMGELGWFADDARLELVDGEIIDMPPIGSRHASVLEHMSSLLTAVIGARALVRPQLPIRLGDHSEPQPDIALVHPRGDRYRNAHPQAGDTLLLVEISDSTLAYDRKVKVPLYARHGIPETWVVDLQHGQVHRYAKPTGGTYTVTSSTTGFARMRIDALDAEVDLSPLDV